MRTPNRIRLLTREESIEYSWDIASLNTRGANFVQTTLIYDS